MHGGTHTTVVLRRSVNGELYCFYMICVNKNIFALVDVCLCSICCSVMSWLLYCSLPHDNPYRFSHLVPVPTLFMPHRHLFIDLHIPQLFPHCLPTIICVINPLFFVALVFSIRIF